MCDTEKEAIEKQLNEKVTRFVERNELFVSVPRYCRQGICVKEKQDQIH